MQGDFPCIACTIQFSPEADHRRSKQDHGSLGLFADNLGTSVYPKFHIPHKLAGRANQGSPIWFYIIDVVNSCSTIFDMSFKIIY